MHSPTDYDKAIFIADRVADRPISTCILGNRRYRVKTTSATSGNILDSILPTNSWYMCHTSNSQFPVLTDYQEHQHHHQHVTMLATRDKHTDYSTTDYWKNTSFSLANFLQPIPKHSYWTAARRCQILYDKVGHGRNLAKMATTQEQATSLSKCKLCGRKDNQEHILLDCPHPALRLIRADIKQHLDEAAEPILKQHNLILINMTKCFLRTAWESHPTRTRRIWLGLWNPHLITHLLCCNIHGDQLLNTTLQGEIKATARTLTRPLLQGYMELLRKAQEVAPSSLPAVQFSRSLNPEDTRHIANAHPTTTSIEDEAPPYSFEAIRYNVFDTTNQAFLLPLSDDSDDTSADSLIDHEEPN